MRVGGGVLCYICCVVRGSIFGWGCACFLSVFFIFLEVFVAGSRSAGDAVAPVVRGKLSGLAPEVFFV